MKGKSKYNPAIHHRRSIRLKGYDYGQAGLYFITICCEGMRHRFGKISVGAPLAGAPLLAGTQNGAQMILNEYGQIAYNEWTKLAERFSNFELDVFQIMPNHFHGIILLTSDHTSPNDAMNNQNGPFENNADDNVSEMMRANAEGRATARVAPTTTTTMTMNETKIATTTNATTAKTKATTATMSDIVGAYKSLVANGCLDIYKSKNETMGKLWQRNYYEHIIRDEKAYQTISDYIMNNPAKWAKDKFYTT